MCNTKTSYIVRQKEDVLQNFVRRDIIRVRQSPDRDTAMSYYYQKVVEEMNSDHLVLQWEITGSFNHQFVEYFKINIGLFDDISKALKLAKEETLKRFESDLVRQQATLFLLSDEELIDRLIQTIAYEEYLERFYDLHNKQNLAGTDVRIYNCMCNKEEIRDYFMQLKKLKENKKSIFSDEQIENLLYSNFSAFNPPKEKVKLHCPSRFKKDIRELVYKFYIKCSEISRTDEYIHLLKNNFQIFDETTFESLKKNFSR